MHDTLILHDEDGQPVIPIRYVWRCPECGNEGLFSADPQSVFVTDWPICWECSGIGVLMDFTGISRAI